MPRFETMNRRQKALVWEKVGVDKYTQPIVGPVTEIQVRWSNNTTQMADANGDLIAVRATVVVDRDIPIGSIMWEGGIKDLPGTAGIPETDLMEVVALSRVPSFKNKGIRRVVGLNRYGDKMPTLE